MQLLSDKGMICMKGKIITHENPFHFTNSTKKYSGASTRKKETEICMSLCQYKMKHLSSQNHRLEKNSEDQPVQLLCSKQDQKGYVAEGIVQSGFEYPKMETPQVL